MALPRKMNKNNDASSSRGAQDEPGQTPQEGCGNGDGGNDSGAACKCNVCARLPLRTHCSGGLMDSDFVYHQGGAVGVGGAGTPALWDPHASEALGMLLDWHPSSLLESPGVGGGLTLHDRDHHNVHTSQLSRPPPRIPHRAACRVADAAQAQLAHLQGELLAAGLPLRPAAAASTTNQRERKEKHPQEEKDPSEEPEIFGYAGPVDLSRVAAPFDKREVVLGPRLGSGGFASVYEVRSFRLLDPVDHEASHKFGPAQIAARHALQQSAAMLPPLTRDDDGSSPLGDAGLLLAHHRTRAKYAVKHLRYSLVENHNASSKYEKAAIDLALEAQLLLAIDHPNIVKLKGWTQHGTHSFRGGCPGDYFLVLDCLPELLDDRFFAWRQMVRTYRNKKSPWWTTLWRNKDKTTHRRKKYDTKLQLLLAERLQVARDLSSALEYLHDHRIVHRDVKSSNIGFDADGVPKLFDFGLARPLPPESECLHDGYVMSRVGTKSNMAPEVAAKRPYGPKADVYSFGIVLWELLSLSTAGEYFRMTKRKRGIVNQPVPPNSTNPVIAVQPPSVSGTTTHTPPSVGAGTPPPVASVAPALQRSRPRRHHHDYSSSAPLPDGTPGFSEDDCVLPLCPCWPAAVQNLVKRCLSYKAEHRPTMAEVTHELFQLVIGLRGDEDGGAQKSRCPRQRRRSTFRLVGGAGGKQPDHGGAAADAPLASKGGADSTNVASSATVASNAGSASVPAPTARRASHSERLAAAVRKAAAAAGPSSGRSHESSTAFASVSLDPSEGIVTVAASAAKPALIVKATS